MASIRRMDDEEFKRRLSEVADWKLPDTPRETSLNAKKKRGRKSAEDEYQELREEIFYEEFGGVNPTYAPMLIKVKCQPTTCEDCGKLCPSGRKKEKKLYETGSKKNRNWREKCVTCNMAKNPFTGKFDLSTQQASFVWTNYLRETKGLYKTSGNEAREKMKVVIEKNNVTIIDNDTETITFHHENKPPA